MSELRALITGVTGQDGSYLAELLLAKGYRVFGLKRRTSTEGLDRLSNLVTHDGFSLLEGDLLDSTSLKEAIERSKPREVYNLAAQSFVGTSFGQPILTGDVTGLGATRLLAAVLSSDKSIRFYQASSSELFGSSPPPQSETTVFHPRSPYGCAKLYAHYMTINAREAYGLHASTGILFNHESARRGIEFVTQKISHGAAAIAQGRQDKLYLGNLEARRDWGHARDYVEAMWLMLQADEPGDYVVATGEAHTVREFAELAFARVGLNYEDHVEIDPRFYRPSEVDVLLGDPSKARRVLGWEPKTSFADLVKEMVDAALAKHKEPVEEAS